MQRGTWILAISGTMAICQNGYAADPIGKQPAGKSTVSASRLQSGSANSKTAQKASGQTRLVSGNNVYKELFADDEPTESVPVKRQLPPTAALKAALRSAGSDFDAGDRVVAPKKPDTALKNVFADLDEDIAEIQAAAAEDKTAASDTEPEKTDKDGKRVSQAIYDRPAGRKALVQQIRNEGRPRSAPPVTGATDRAERAPRATISKRAEQRDVFADDEDTSTHQTSQPESKSNLNQTGVFAPGPQASQISVEWAKRGEFNIGQECLVDLIVKNIGPNTVVQVAIDALFPADVRLTSAEPRPAINNERLTWAIDQIAAGEEKKITIKLIPASRNDIGAVAQVRFTATSAAAFSVSEPLLKINVKSSAKEFLLGDPASQMVTVTNPGTGTAQDVKIEAKLSDGLEHATREDRLVIEVGPIGPGESRTYRLGLTTIKGGPQSVSVVATSSTEASSTDTIKFDVISPSLKVAVEGPSLRYKGRVAKYNLTITNDGSLANNNIHVSQSLAEGFKFIAADHSGKHDASSNSVNWFVGRLEPGESAVVACELRALQIGEFTHTVQVVSDTGVQADSKIETRVDGIASLTMEVVDLDDPVETGSETGYEIRLKNDGSKAATDVVVACDLSAGMDLLDTKAPVDQVLEGRQLTFSPIEQIAPGGQVTIRILTKVVRDGSHRLRVRLTSGSLPEPMILEEVTRAYSDGSN